jgi:hypothetical protein
MSGEPIIFISGRQVVWRRHVLAGKGSRHFRLHPWAVIFRRLVAQFLDRQVGDFLALVQDAEAQVVGGLADDGEVEAPLVEDRLGFLSFSGRSTMSMRSWLSDSIIS